VVIVVLLKDGKLDAVSSESRDVFALARARDAGICGIFEDRENAEAYMEALRREQKRNRWSSYGTMHTGKQSAG
jgi:predicted nucleotidyltransferase